MPDGHAEIFQHRFFTIAEGHMREHDIPVQIRLEGVFLLRFCRFVEDLPDTVQRDHALSGVRQDASKLADREEQLADIGGIDDQNAQRDFPADRRGKADEQRDHGLRHAQEIARRPVNRQQQVHTEVLIRQVSHFFMKLVDFIGLPAERAHDANARQVFLQHRAHAAFSFVRGAERFHDPLEEQEREQEQHGYHQHGEQGQADIPSEQDSQRNHDHEYRVDHRHHLHGQEAAHRIHIRRAALHQIARFGAHVIGKRQLLDMLIQHVSQITGNILPCLRLETALAVRKQSVQHIQPDDREPDQVQMAHHIIGVAINADPLLHNPRQHTRLPGQIMVQRFRQNQRNYIIKNDTGDRAEKRAQEPGSIPAEQPLDQPLVMHFSRSSKTTK